MKFGPLLVATLFVLTIFNLPNASATSPIGTPCVGLVAVYKNPTNGTETIRVLGRVDAASEISPALPYTCNSKDVTDGTLKGFILKRSTTAPADPFNPDPALYTTVFNLSFPNIVAGQNYALFDWSAAANTTYHYIVQAYGVGGPNTEASPPSADTSICRCVVAIAPQANLIGYSPNGVTMEVGVAVGVNTDAFVSGHPVYDYARFSIGTASDGSDQVEKAILFNPSNFGNSTYIFSGLVPNTVYYVGTKIANNESTSARSALASVQLPPIGSAPVGAPTSAPKPSFTFAANITTTLATNNWYNPKWRPQGDYVAGVGLGQAANQSINIMTRQPNGILAVVGWLNLTTNPQDFAWSPDGTMIAVAEEYGGLGIYQFNQGATPTFSLLYKLNPTPGFFSTVSWSVANDIAVVGLSGTGVSSHVLYSWNGAALVNQTWNIASAVAGGPAFVIFSLDGGTLFTYNFTSPSNFGVDSYSVFDHTAYFKNRFNDPTMTAGGGTAAWNAQGTRLLYGSGSTSSILSSFLTWDGDVLANVSHDSAPISGHGASFDPINTYAVVSTCSGGSGPVPKIINVTADQFVDTADATVTAGSTRACATQMGTVAWSPLADMVLSCASGTAPILCKQFNSSEAPFQRPHAQPIVNLTQTSDTSIVVNWSIVSGASTYNVYRWTDGGVPSLGCAVLFTCTVNSTGFSFLGSVNAFTFNDTTTSPLTTYTYAVLGANVAGEGPPGNATITIGNPSPPTAPVLTATLSADCQSVTINWTASTGIVGGYLVTRGFSGYQTYSEPSSFLGPLTFNLNPSNSTFSVHATNAGGAGPESNVFTAKACALTIAGGGGALFGPGGAGPVANALGTSVSTANILMGILIMAGVAGGAASVFGVVGAVGGAGLGLVLVFMLGLFPFWVVMFIVAVAFGAFVLWRRRSGGTQGGG